MAFSIYKYSKSIVKVRSVQAFTRYYRFYSYYAALALMCFFFLGYIATGFLIAFSSTLSIKDFVIASVFLFGAVFVDIMIEAQHSMVSLHAKEVLGTITDNISTMIYVVDPQNYEVLFANKALAKCADNDLLNILGKSCWKSIRYEKEPCSYCPVEILTDANRGLDIPYFWEFECARLNKYFFVTSSLVRWVDGRHVMLHSFVDISERKKYETNLQICASTDKLTSAYNRTWGYQLLESILSPDSITELPVTLCFLDLDNLKQINDTFGHECGDKALCQLAEIIKSNVRQNDTLIRWGGDEFILLLYCGYSGAQNVVEKITKHTEYINSQNTVDYSLSFSYGLEEISERYSHSLDERISRADIKMYEQKIRKKELPTI